MTISTRTWEGIPHLCPICKHESKMEVSPTFGDSCCPICGSLMWIQEDRVAIVQASKEQQTKQAVPVLYENWVQEQSDAPTAPKEQTQTTSSTVEWYEKWAYEQSLVFLPYPETEASVSASKQTLSPSGPTKWYDKWAAFLARCALATLNFLCLQKKNKPEHKRTKSE